MRQLHIKEDDARFRLSDACSVLMNEEHSLLAVLQNFQLIIFFLLIEREAKQLDVGFAKQPARILVIEDRIPDCISGIVVLSVQILPPIEAVIFRIAGRYSDYSLC
jgi:hypothetical protein